MPHTHNEVLTENQNELILLVSKFSKDFGLVGGTAIALQIGHRESIDFDLFSIKKFSNEVLRKKISNIKKIDNVIVDKLDEFTFLIKDVKITFFYYDFPIKFTVNFENIIKMPNLLTLASMKAYALGRRAKWKDYVDLYFIIKNFYSVSKISEKAKLIFKGEFNERIFRTQLAYFKDINYNEEIVFKKGFKTSDNEIKKSLIEFSLS